ncbi:mucin-2-like isoform X2 [Palaemon carinicauda]|uniref:mucin-2-like isoform X2 n=1 Tax=Palaemon carinicauda TaxID=392227 RepID=UPI0035B585D5
MNWFYLKLLFITHFNYVLHSVQATLVARSDIRWNSTRLKYIVKTRMLPKTDPLYDTLLTAERNWSTGTCIEFEEAEESEDAQLIFERRSECSKDRGLSFSENTIYLNDECGSHNLTGNKAIFRTKDVNFRGTPGIYESPSSTDIFNINRIYDCSGGSIPNCNHLTSNCRNGGYLMRVDGGCRCICPPSTTGSKCKGVDKSFYDHLRSPCIYNVTTQPILVELIKADENDRYWCVIQIRHPWRAASLFWITDTYADVKYWKGAMVSQTNMDDYEETVVYDPKFAYIFKFLGYEMEVLIDMTKVKDTIRYFIQRLSFSSLTTTLPTTITPTTTTPTTTTSSTTTPTTTTSSTTTPTTTTSTKTTTTNTTPTTTTPTTTTSTTTTTTPTTTTSSTTTPTTTTSTTTTPTTTTPTTTAPTTTTPTTTPTTSISSTTTTSTKTTSTTTTPTTTTSTTTTPTTTTSTTTTPTTTTSTTITSTTTTPTTTTPTTATPTTTTASTIAPTTTTSSTTTLTSTTPTATTPTTTSSTTTTTTSSTTPITTTIPTTPTTTTSTKTTPTTATSTTATTTVPSTTTPRTNSSTTTPTNTNLTSTLTTPSTMQRTSANNNITTATDLFVGITSSTPGPVGILPSFEPTQGTELTTTTKKPCRQWWVWNPWSSGASHLVLMNVWHIFLLLIVCFGRKII